MSSDLNVTPPPENGAPGGPSAVTPAPPPAGLPPVAPPSGKLMLQLFLVPGLIVACLVVIALGWRWLFGGPVSKKDFLDRLADANPEVRWRTAENLAQVLLRDDELASDGDFARQLGLMLEKARDDSRQGEKAFLDFQTSLNKSDLNEQQRKEKLDAERKKVEGDRTFISFLTASLGDFMVPVGAPVLKELAADQEGVDPKVLVLRRRQAVWALANLGENLKRFDALTDEEKNAVLGKLDAAAQAAGEHADWLRAALDALRKRPKNESDDLGVGKTLIDCSKDKDDPYLRELSAFAMNFWRGDETANAAMEERLADLTRDDGAGDKGLIDASEEKDQGPTVAVSRPSGLQIEYNAAVALARFGSKKVRLDMLRDMLDEEGLKTRLVLHPRDRADEDKSQDRPNDEVIGQTLTNTLKAVAELHKLRPDLDLSSLKASVDALASGSGNPAVRTEAEKTRLALNP